jgi:hypothetical protein
MVYISSTCPGPHGSHAAMHPIVHLTYYESKMPMELDKTFESLEM